MTFVEFEVSEQLKAYGIKRIAQIGNKTLRAEYHDIPIVTKFEFDDFTASMNRFRREAERYISSNGVDAEKIVNDLVMHVTKVTSDYYEQNGNGKSDSTGTNTVAEVGVGNNTVLRMAPRPTKARCNMQDWSNAVKKKHTDLKTVTENRLPGLWLPLEFAVAVRSILHIKNISLPFIAVLLGPPSSNKSLAVDAFEGARYVFATDDFSAKAFVSHNSGVSDEELAKIDLLPKISNKMFLVPELSPLFTTKDDELANVFGIITRIADGKGYVSDTGAKGHRGYRGKMMFVWLGAAVDIPYKIHKMLSNLGPKLYFLRLPATQETENDLLEILKEDDFKERLQEVNSALYEYLELFESSPAMEPDPQLGNIPRLEMDAANPLQEDAQRYIIRLAELLAHLRGTVSTWETEGTQGLDYAYSTPYIENPKRAIQQLFNLARGHAISQGRNYITVKDDIPLVVKVVLSGAASVERVRVLSALLDKTDSGYLDVAGIKEITGMAEKSAKKVMAEFKALGLVDLLELGISGDPYLQIRLKDGFSWFLSDEFRDLRQGYMPGDFSNYLVSRTKNTPHVEKKNNSDGLREVDDGGRGAKEEDSN
jgi:hypothetical protein